MQARQSHTRIQGAADATEPVSTGASQTWRIVTRATVGCQQARKNVATGGLRELPQAVHAAGGTRCMTRSMGGPLARGGLVVVPGSGGWQRGGGDALAIAAGPERAAVPVAEPVQLEVVELLRMAVSCASPRRRSSDSGGGAAPADARRHGLDLAGDGRGPWSCRYPAARRPAGSWSRPGGAAVPYPGRRLRRRPAVAQPWQPHARGGQLQATAGKSEMSA